MASHVGLAMNLRCKKMVRRRPCPGGWHLCGWVLTLFLLAMPAAARSTAAKLDQAREYYDGAKEAHAALQEIPLDRRTEKDYQRVVEAFRHVYRTAPTYGNNTICLMAIAELSEEAARLFREPKYFETALDSYEFLLREYPNSQFRFDALLSIARIHREDLRQPEEALSQYQRYLKTYPRSAQTKRVEVAIAQIQDEIGSQPAAAPAPPKNETAAAPAVAPPASQPAGATKDRAAAALVSDVRYWTTPTSSRVVVDVERKVEYSVGRLDSPARLFLDLQNTRVTPPAGKTLPVGDPMVQQIRLAQYKTGVARIVLDLTSPANYEISELTNPYRLVIDVHGGGQAVAAGNSTPRAEQGTETKQSATPSAAAPGPANVPAKPAGGTESAAVQPGSHPLPASQSPAAASVASAEGKNPPKPVETAKALPKSEPIKVARPIPGGAHSLTRALGLKIGRILLDPGHGGHDTGTIGPAGLMEKELTLDLAERLGKLIEEGLGSEVVYTREDDSFVSLEDRAVLANNSGADLFLSIHANSSKATRVTGVETYYLSLTNDADALAVAARENAVSQETVSDLQGLVRKIALNEKVDESKEFATRVQSALSKGLAPKKTVQFNRGVKKAPFVVLIGADMPSILTEVTFLSNPDEEKRLKAPEYRQKIAEALYKGIAGYVDTMSGVKVASAPAAAAPTQTASLDSTR